MNISSFPFISTTEFEEACRYLEARFSKKGYTQHDWLSVTLLEQDGTKYLRITSALHGLEASKPSTVQDHGDNREREIQEDDEEALTHPARSESAELEYTIVLSPSYRIPVLYIQILHPYRVYPPTAETLHSCVLRKGYGDQVEAVGVMGAVTVADHPVTNLPVWFVHPCHTHATLEACKGFEQVSPESYLLLWMGIIGGCVGLHVPPALLA